MGIFLYHTTDLLWFVLWYWTWRCLHLIGHHHFLLQLFGNPELLSYNAAFTPPCVKQGWGPPAELWIQFRRHLSPGIRRKYCYCFPNEPPSSSRLPTHISTNNHQCQSTLQQTKGNNPPASTISSTTHLLYSPESTAASLHALWDLKGAPNTSSQQHDP